MDDPSPTPAGRPAPVPGATPAPAGDAPKPPPKTLYQVLFALLGIFVIALVFGIWGAVRVLFPDAGDPQQRLAAQQARLERLEQEVATLTRSDQISRQANRELQGTLAERDEEIAGLRADVAFYERFVGATGQRRGLSVHALRVEPLAGRAWRFVGTLTQNINRGEVSRGRLTLSVEGLQDGRLKRLSWSELRQQLDAPGREYSFKYFQQVEGDFVLPPGFEPLRVLVRLVPERGAAVERTVPWAEAMAAASAPSAPGT